MCVQPHSFKQFIILHNRILHKLFILLNQLKLTLRHKNHNFLSKLTSYFFQLQIHLKNSLMWINKQVYSLLRSSTLQVFLYTYFQQRGLDWIDVVCYEDIDVILMEWRDIQRVYMFLLVEVVPHHVHYIAYSVANLPVYAPQRITILITTHLNFFYLFILSRFDKLSLPKHIRHLPKHLPIVQIKSISHESLMDIVWGKIKYYRGAQNYRAYFKFFYYQRKCSRMLKGSMSDKYQSDPFYNM